MRIAAALLIGWALLWSVPVCAAPDNSNKDHTKHQNNGNAAGNGRQAIASPTPSDSPPVDGPTDQNLALDAVKDGAALPLSEIVALARAKWGGRAIDAKLLTASGVLIYELTMLSDQGVSQRVYYEARSGRSVLAP